MLLQSGRKVVRSKIKYFLGREVPVLLADELSISTY